MSEKKHRVSRRQFLNYSLMGLGGFMAASAVSPMVRFAIDPVLAVSGESDFISVTTEDDITNEPQRFTFTAEVVDAWYETDRTYTAWIYKEGEEIIALSPTCTHLGCTVNWNTNVDHENEFFCPCHGGRFTKEGTNVPNTPPTRPLDIYELEIRDGTVYLGKTIERR